MFETVNSFTGSGMRRRFRHHYQLYMRLMRPHLSSTKTLDGLYVLWARLPVGFSVVEMCIMFLLVVAIVTVVCTSTTFTKFTDENLIAIGLYCYRMSPSIV